MLFTVPQTKALSLSANAELDAAAAAIAVSMLYWQLASNLTTTDLIVNIHKSLTGLFLSLPDLSVSSSAMADRKEMLPIDFLARSVIPTHQATVVK